MSDSKAIVQSQDAVIDRYRHGLEPTTFDSACKLAGIIASTRLCGLTSAEDALTRIMTGRELGLSAMQSIRGVYVVEGRPALDASLMHALCLQSPECDAFYCVEDGIERVTYLVKRKGQAEQRITWTIEDARRAGLLDRGKDPKTNNWNKYPRQMLHARCKSEGARRVFPERLFGLLSREEIVDGDIVAEVVTSGMSEQAFEAATKDAAPTFDGTEKDLLAMIASAFSKEEVKAVRDAIRKAKDDGLPEPWFGRVSEAYNSKFAKKPAPAASPVTQEQSAREREPGEDG